MKTESSLVRYEKYGSILLLRKRYFGIAVEWYENREVQSKRASGDLGSTLVSTSGGRSLIRDVDNTHLPSAEIRWRNCTECGVIICHSVIGGFVARINSGWCDGNSPGLIGSDLGPDKGWKEYRRYQGRTPNTLIHSPHTYHLIMPSRSPSDPRRCLMRNTDSLMFVLALSGLTS